MTHPWRDGGVGFVGAGAVGSALARALRGLGYPVVAVASRSRASARELVAQLPGCALAEEPQQVADRCTAVFITTPDDAIAPVVQRVRWRTGQDVVHCSGAASVELLAPARAAGADTGGFHPLQTFPDRAVPPAAFQGITFAIQAEGVLRERLERLATELGGRCLRLSEEDRALYHASAVLACGAVAAVVGAAADLWGSLVNAQHRDDALEALLPLVRGTATALERQGLPSALTGPVARGDAGTVAKHLEALRRRAPEAVSLYCQLGLAQLRIARANGGCDEESALRLEQLFHGGLKAGRQGPCPAS